MSRYYLGSQPTTVKKTRCNESFLISSPEDYKKNDKYIDLSTAMFFLPKKPGNYYKTYVEINDKYTKCKQKKKFEQCTNLYTDMGKAEKEFKSSLINDTKNKVNKKIENTKNKDDLDKIACYLKLLHNLVATCGNVNRSLGSDYITTLKEKLRAQYTNETDRNNVDSYIKNLLENIEDSSANQEFKILDKKFRNNLNKIINENYKTCS